MRIRGVAVLAVCALAWVLPPEAQAAPTLAQIQAQVNDLQDQATAAAEGAQEAKVKLAALQRSLSGIQAQAAIQGKNVDSIEDLKAELALHPRVIVASLYNN